MNGQQILQALKNSGITFTDIAKIANVSTTTVSQVAHRKGSSRRIALGLAAALSKPVEKVFPDCPQYHRHIANQEERQRLISNVKDALIKSGYTQSKSVSAAA